MEQRTFWRSAEYALFTFALPLALLLLIGSTTANGDLPGTHVEGQMIFVPSIIAFGVIVAAYVNLGAKLATLRHDGVLKRIRTTPLPASAYLSGVLGSSTAATTLAITAMHHGHRRVRLPRGAAGERPAGDRRRPHPRRRLLRRPRRRAQLGRPQRRVGRPDRQRQLPADRDHVRHLRPDLRVPRWLSAPSRRSRSAPSPRSSSRATPRSPTPPWPTSFVLLAWTAAGCAFAAWRFRWH